VILIDMNDDNDIFCFFYGICLVVYALLLFM